VAQDAMGIQETEVEKKRTGLKRRKHNNKNAELAYSSLRGN